MSHNDSRIDHALRHTRFGQRLLEAEPALREELRQHLGTPYTREAMLTFLSEHPIQDEADLKRALRQLKKKVYLRLIVRDLSGLADLHEVVTTISHLAILAVQQAQQHWDRWLSADYGQPLGEESGTPQQLIVVGMGKLGGDELNVSSDIDLIYVYPEDGHTMEPGKLSNHEYFTRLAQKLSQTISELTEDGYVFRVDLRLRPYGDSGPVVSSFAMLEEYFLTQGREWERYAWIKGRALTGDAAGLQALVHPFVYRKYLDFGAFASMRNLHAQIRREVARRDLADNIKLGPGGIREIEFIAQVFQLIRGGKAATLQSRSTRETLNTIAERNLLPAETVAGLQAAYVFLRNLEHRLQYLDDAQTQNLPTSEADQARIAESMHCADWAAFCAELNHHRTRVEADFESIFAADDEEASPQTSPWHLEPDAADTLAAMGYLHPAAIIEVLQRVKQSQRYLHLPTGSRIRFNALMPRIIQEAAAHGDAAETLNRLIALMEAISRRESYLALLAEYPDTLSHVAKVCGASSWAAAYLTQHPILLDELLDTRALMEKRNWHRLARKLHEDLGDFAGTERQMDTFRHFKHAQTFHLLAQDLEGVLTIESLSDELSALADCILNEVLRITWQALTRKHSDTPHFAIIGYGKLGGKELGYASDLDIVFLYEDPHESATETYARLAQRINSWLTTLTPAGVLYETDLRLRPDGASGLMVSSVEAFRHYQQDLAWVWEHQALTRARFVAGDTAIGAAFESIRRDTISQARDLVKLHSEILAMRQKMRDAHANKTGLFDIKHDPGGIVDVEFMVQYLVLAHAHVHSDLVDNVGNLALLTRAAAHGLIPPEQADAVRDAYREYRRLQHRERMQGREKSRIDPAPIAHHIQAVRQLWDSVMTSSH